MKNRNAMGSTKTDELIANKFKANHQKGLVLKKNLDLSQKRENRHHGNLNLLSKDHHKKKQGEAEMKDSALEIMEDRLNDSNLTTTTKGAMNRTSNNISANSKGE